MIYNQNEKECCFSYFVSTMPAAIGKSAFASGHQLLATVTVAEIL